MKRRSHKFVIGSVACENLLNSPMSEPASAEIAGIYRYPVKGLSPEPLQRVALAVGQTLLADRRYAIENGPSGFDPADPKWMSKAYFLMLQRDEWLAGLQTHFDDASNVLTIRHNGSIVAQADLETAEGRAAIERFFASHFANRIKGPPKILKGKDHSFSDVAKKVVSIINLASLNAIGDIVEQPVHPLRFRANLHVQGWPAWREFDLLGQTLAIGEARLKVVKRITRCAAVNVDPDTAARDLNILHTLMRRFGHADCGVYAEVVSGGEVAEGDGVSNEEPTLLLGWAKARLRRAHPAKSPRRHHIGVHPAARVNRFGNAMVVIAGHHDRIARRVDAADHADMSAAAPPHHRDGADLRARDALAVACERARHVRAGAVQTGVLQHHVHEARAPQAAATGGIAADVAARLGDHIRGAETGGRRHAALCEGNRARLLDTSVPTPCVREVAMMIMPDVVMVMMRASVPPCAVMMRPCRSRSC